ncbi:MAG: HAD family hydrolase [Flavitalea sp.]
MSKQQIDLSSVFGQVPQAIIFDMDGTLIESTEADYIAWKMLFAEYRIDLSFDKYYPLLGKKSIDVISSQLHLTGDEVNYALAKKLFYYKEYVEQHGVLAVPHALRLVEYCSKHFIIGLATSSREEKMKMMMEQQGLINYFNAIVTGGEVHHGKPSPDIFLLAAKKLNVDPLKCIVFEDTISGILAAKNAGMKCIAITTTHKRHELKDADLIVDSYTEFKLD